KTAQYRRHHPHPRPVLIRSMTGRRKDASTVGRLNATLSVRPANCLTMTRTLFRFPLLLAATLLTGCATNSLFNPYPNQAADWKQAAAVGQPEAAFSRLEKGTQGGDRLLY